MKTNEYIKTRLIAGKQYLSSKYKYLQCGEYLNNEFLAIREMGSYLDDAKADIKKYPVDKPQTGDCVFMDYGIKDKNGSIPHKAIVEATDDIYVWLTEANFSGDGVVGHGRKIKITDKHILGFARVPLNAVTQAAQPKPAQIPEWALIAAKRAKEKGIITDWSDPNRIVTSETLEFVFEKLKLLDPKKHEGQVTISELAVVLDRLNLFN